MTEPVTEPTIPQDDIDALRAAVDDVMDVHDTTYAPVPGVAIRSPGHLRIAVRFRGRLRIASDEAYRIVSERLSARNYTPLFRRDGDADTVLIAEGVPDTSSRLWLALLLFAITFLSVLYAGALNEVQDLVGAVIEIYRGLPFALSLMGILVAHEMGHFVVGRLIGVPMSFPFFIPLPIPLPVLQLGTMGAVIQMKAPPVNRRSMLIVGAAGPIAGLIVALPVLLLGFAMSQVTPLDMSQPFYKEGDSILYLLLKFLWFGKVLPGGGEDVLISGVAFAGWAGLLVTMLNLIPVGQLDGGHIVNALFGDRIAWLRWPIILVLLILGSLDLFGLPGGWMGWLIWAGILFVLGGIRAEPLDDITRLKPWHWALGLVMIVVFILIFMPVPLAIWGEFPPPV